MFSSQLHVEMASTYRYRHTLAVVMAVAASMVSESLAGKLVEAGNDPGGGFRH